MDILKVEEARIKGDRVLREAGFEFITSNTYGDMLEEPGIHFDESDTKYIDVVFDEYQYRCDSKEMPWLAFEQRSSSTSCAYGVKRLFISRDGSILVWKNNTSPRNEFLICNLGNYKSVSLLIGSIPGVYPIKQCTEY